MLTKEDFRFCETHNVFFDTWQIDNYGPDEHKNCTIRNVTDDESVILIKNANEPKPQCPDCEFPVHEHSLDENNEWVYYCPFCQDLFPKLEIIWINDFGSCYAPD